MADNKEIKVKSFRIDDETASKFKEISASIGGNQQETMQLLINAYCMQEQKAVLVDYKANLETIENYTTAILQMYTTALQENKSTKETVRAEFEALLKSKDTVIQELQAQVTTAKQLKEDATDKAKVYADENVRLNNTIETLNSEYKNKLEDVQEKLLDKDNLNKALTDSCNDLKYKNECMKADVEQMSIIKNKLTELQQKYDKLVITSESLKSELSENNSMHKEMIENLKKHEEQTIEHIREQLQLAQEKAVLAVEKKYQEQIEKLKLDKQAEIDKYQSKYFDLIEQLKEK
jgi:chromosome segregation ATPase